MDYKERKSIINKGIYGELQDIEYRNNGESLVEQLQELICSANYNFEQSKIRGGSDRKLQEQRFNINELFKTEMYADITEYIQEITDENVLIVMCVAIFGYDNFRKILRSWVDELPDPDEDYDYDYKAQVRHDYICGIKGI